MSIRFVEAVPPDEEDMDMDSNEENQEIQNDKTMLSKNWTEKFAHAPSYSGGKVTLCNSKGTRHIYGYDETTKGDDFLTPFIVAPCGGDLTLIDAIRGVKARTIREGCDCAKRDLDEEDESIDTDAIVAYALAPNDCDLITASRNNILRHYDISGSPSHSYNGVDGRGAAKVNRVLGRTGHDLPVSCIEFHSSGVFFATGSIDGNVKVWDLRGGYATHSFRYHAAGYSSGSNDKGGLRGGVTSLSWCPDVTKLWLAVGRDDGSVRVHDLRMSKEEEEEKKVELTDHVGPVKCIVWATGSGRSSGYDTLFTAGRDAVLNTWSISEEVCDKAVNTFNKPKKKRSNSGDGAAPSTKMVYKRLQTLPVYESIEAIQILPNFYTYHDSTSLSIDRNDIVLATAGSKGVVKIWKSVRSSGNDESLGQISGLVLVLTQDQQYAFGEEKGGYTGLMLTSHKQDLYGKDEHGNLTRTEELIAVDAEHNMSFLKVMNGSDGKNKIMGIHRTIIGHNDEILDLKIIPNATDSFSPIESRKIAVATNSSQVRLFELGSFSCSVLNGHTETVLSLDVSPCGRYITTSGKDQTMRIWSIETLKCIALATGHTEAVGATGFSKKATRFDVSGKAAKNGSGSFVVTASKDKTLKRWNLPGSSIFGEIAESNEQPLELGVHCSTRAHEKDINIVTVAPNDSLVATGSQDKTVKLWSSSDLSLVGTLSGHKRGVWDCQFSKHDRVIATCSGDKSVKLWSLGDFSCVRTFQGHTTAALRVRFLSGGLQLMSCDSEGLLRLWTIRSNECIFTLDAHEDRVWAMDVENDMLVSGGADSRLKVFVDTTKDLEEQTRQEEEISILKEQKLANHLRRKEYDQALDLALEMAKPLNVLKVLTSIIETQLSAGVNPLEAIQKHAKSWSDERILQIFQYCREWNTRARNCHVSMLAMQAILKTKPAGDLASITGLSDILLGIAPYAERHFERIDKLHTESFLIDFCLQSMGDLDMTDNQEYIEWEKNSKLVLPPTEIDGRVQVGGTDVVGYKMNDYNTNDDSSTIASDAITVGASSSDSDSSDDESS